MKIILFIFSVFLVTGCASNLKIASDVPARIEMGGQHLCTTPCKIDTTWWPEFPRTFEAYPINSNEGFKQTKRVVFNLSGDTDVFFQMKSSSIGILLNNNEEKNVESTGEKKLNNIQFLNKMKEEGKISEEQYNNLLKNIINSQK